MKTRIEKYLSGQLSGAERNALEKEALNDPFLADAIEGFELSGNTSISTEVSDTFKEKFFGGGNTWAFKWLIGAGIIAVFIGAFFFMNDAEKQIEDLSDPQVVLVEKSNSETSIPTKPKVTGLEEEKVPTEKPEIKVEKNSVMVINEESIPENKFELNEEIVPIKTIEIDQIEDSVPQSVSDPKLKRIRGSNMKLDYFYSLKVVDYSSINRSSIRVDKTLKNGTPAYMENQETDNGMSINFEENNWVPYMDYLEGAMKQVSKGRNKLALQKFNIIFDNFPEDANAQFYGGLCNFYLKRFDEAMALFDAVKENKTNTFHEEADWHRLLCYKATGQTTLFKVLKKNIVGLEGFYADRAKGLNIE